MKGQVYNPFLPDDVYIPDGEPHVFGDKVYLFGSHDKEGGDSFCLLDYEGWSAPVSDLGKWESAGIIYSAKQDPLYSEKRPYLYAPDVVQGNDGRFYLYYCLAGWKGDGGYDGPISIAVSDQPNGRYEYYGIVKHQDGTPFLDCITFDPAVMNDNGVIRLYCGAGMFWGMQFRKWNEKLLASMASGTYHRPASEFTAKENPLGAYTVVLADDMMTVQGKAKCILPEPSGENGFKGHAFFEGASIRKVGDLYYFVYSSQKNHELCYATSKYPDRDFVYGGTIISNGDVGFQKRKEKDRMNITGTTHGGMECIDGKWYIFYHRLTHGSDYSRQACAERIEIGEDGVIAQVEMTSCGLNGGPLSTGQVIPATKACNLTNGRMPHISNRKLEKAIPMITGDGIDRYIKGINKGTVIGFKYFRLDKGRQRMAVTYRGEGKGELLIYYDLKGKPIGKIEIVPSREWTIGECNVRLKEDVVVPIYLIYKGTGNVDLLNLIC